jgi:DNA-binding NarL/FixJ family response regulator
MSESEGSSEVRVLVAEDSVPFRSFIGEKLRENSGLRIVGEVSDGLEAVRLARQLKPELIILDIGLATLDGINAARQIRELSPKSKIIFLSMESSPAVVQEAFNLGAWGYVAKARAATDLLIAVQMALEGRRFVSGG